MKQLQLVALNYGGRASLLPSQWGRTPGAAFAATTHPALVQLETQWPDSANPYSVAYLAVDRLLAANGPLPLRAWCDAVGRGVEWHAAFAQAFGEPTDTFYARFASFESAYLR